MRCYDLLGEKIIFQLLLKKRKDETMENRIIITIVLWNLLYVWWEYLVHNLILIPVESGYNENDNDDQNSYDRINMNGNEIDNNYDNENEDGGGSRTLKGGLMDDLWGNDNDPNLRTGTGSGTGSGARSGTGTRLGSHMEPRMGSGIGSGSQMGSGSGIGLGSGPSLVDSNSNQTQALRSICILSAARILSAGRVSNHQTSVAMVSTSSGLFCSFMASLL